VVLGSAATFVCGLILSPLMPQSTPQSELP
jgi:hypothetical protein